ncbi:hypothetical protein HA402_011557 [Bradysia odoriphaga]|nr:hypothetical protein HA402_011557 [Bradysia odoriphaga]
MKKFKLKLTKELWKSQNELLVLRRKHSTIEMVDVSANWHCTLSKVFEKFGPFLRTLSIYNSTLDDFTLLTILKSSPVLEDLFMSEVEIEQKLPAINPISIVHLTSVSIHHTNWLIFKFLSRSQITSLLINNYLNEGEGTRDHLVSMLSYQYRLRELILHGTSSKTLFRDSDLNSNWNNRLSKFHIACGFGKNSDVVDSNIAEFLILNNESLGNVEISIPNCEQITVFIILNLQNVTSLTLDVGRLPKDTKFYQLLVDTEPNCQLKHLKLSGFFSLQAAFVKVILSHYPAIVNLELDDWSNTISNANTLKFVAEKFPHLQQLFIPAITKSSNELKFRALKQLHVSYVRDIENLIRFVQHNGSLETLKIGLVYIEQIPSIFKLMDTQVQHLSFAGSAKSLQMIFDLIRLNPSRSLKTLELSLMSHENYSRFSSVLRKEIKINFSNNSPDLHAKVDAFFNDGRSCWLSGF